MELNLMLTEIKRYGLDILDIQLDEELIKVGFNDEVISFVRFDNLQDDILATLTTYESVNTMNKVRESNNRDVIEFFFNNNIQSIRDLIKKGYDINLFKKYMDDNFLNLIYCESLTDYLNNKYLKVDKEVVNFFNPVIDTFIQKMVNDIEDQLKNDCEVDTIIDVPLADFLGVKVDNLNDILLSNVINSVVMILNKKNYYECYQSSNNSITTIEY